MDTKLPFPQEPHTAARVAEQLLEAIPLLRQLISAEARSGGALTAAQLRVLSLVAKGACLPSEVARELRITPASTSEIVDLLVRRGLLERRDLPEDRRSTLLRLTPDGVTAWVTARERNLAVLQSLLAGLEPGNLDALDQGLSSLLRCVRARPAAINRIEHAN